MEAVSPPAVQTGGFEHLYEYRHNYRIQTGGPARSRLGSAMVCLSGMGMLYQCVATAMDKRRFPPPGRLIDICGCCLHLQSAGRDTPTIVLEAGLGGMSSAWGWIQPETAKFGHVVSYDRAGLGWSGSDPSPKSAIQAAVRLRALLRCIASDPPFVLVGHSMGGLLVRVFNDLFPNDVAGVVLVDASHPDQHRRSSAIETHMRTGFRMLKTIPALAGIGYVRLSGFFDSWAEGLPQRQAAEAESFLSSCGHLKTTRDESLAWDGICAEVRASRGLGDKPLAVVTACRDVLPGQPELQAELATLSMNSVHIPVKGADHVTLVTHRQHASSVVEAIRHVVRACTAGR